MAGPCVFCDIVQGSGPDGLIAYQDDAVCVFASRDQRPTNLGHMLVVTCQHYQDLYELPAALYEAVMGAVRRTAQAVSGAFEASGTTIRQNNGPPGQDVFHLHFHVMPRHLSDNNLAARYQLIDLATRRVQAQAVRAILATV